MLGDTRSAPRKREGRHSQPAPRIAADQQPSSGACRSLLGPGPPPTAASTAVSTALLQIGSSIVPESPHCPFRFYEIEAANSPSLHSLLRHRLGSSSAPLLPSADSAKPLRYGPAEPRPRCTAGRPLPLVLSPNPFVPAVRRSFRPSRPRALSLESSHTEYRAGRPPTHLPYPALSLQPCRQSMLLARRPPSPSPSHHVVPPVAAAAMGIGLLVVRRVTRLPHPPPSPHTDRCPLLLPRHSVPPTENTSVPTCADRRPSPRSPA